MTARQLTVLVPSARFISARFGAEICHRRLGGRRARRLPRIAGWTPEGDRVLATTSAGRSAYTQGGKEKQRTLQFWQTRLVAPREPGRRRQVSLGLVTMAETIQTEMSCFPAETGSSRIFDDKTVQGLDKRRRRKQKGLDTKRQQQQPRSYLSYPNNPTTNTPNATNLFPPKDLSGHQRRRVRQRKPGHTGRRIAPPLPSACLVQHHLSFRPLSKRHNADSSRRGPAGDNLCASSPFARKHPCPDYSRYRRFDAGLADAGDTAISRPTGGSLPPTAMR